jgi:hypothetical protein
VKNIGKPCAGKSHARFDEGGLANAARVSYLGTLKRKGREHAIHAESGGNRLSTLPKRSDPKQSQEAIDLHPSTITRLID